VSLFANAVANISLLQMEKATTRVGSLAQKTGWGWGWGEACLGGAQF